MAIEDNTFSWDDFPTDNPDLVEGKDGELDVKPDPIPGEEEDEPIIPIVGDPDELEEAAIAAAAAKKAEEEDDDPIPAPPKDPETPEPENPDDPKAGEGTEGMSGIELYLAGFDVEGGMINFNDGTSKHFDELDPAKQAEVLGELHSTQSKSVQDQFGLDENEVGLINYLRTNKTTVDDMVNQMVEERVQRATDLNQISGEDYANMTNDAVHLKMMKTINPEATEEQLATELETAKSLSGYDKQADYFRRQFIADQEGAIAQQRQAEQQVIEQEREQDRAAVVNAVSPMKDIAGIELTDDIKNSVFDRVLEVNEQNDTLFLEDATTDPENLFKAAFWFYNGEAIVKQRDEYWKREKSAAYKRGREEALGQGGTGNKVSFIGTRQQQEQNISTPNKPDEFHSDDSIHFE